MLRISDKFNKDRRLAFIKKPPGNSGRFFIMSIVPLCYSLNGSQP